MILRDYQIELTDKVFKAWDRGATNVLVQSHTGSGKTVMLTSIVERANVPTVIIAHRIELVSQLSLALARAGIQHNIISPRDAIESIIQLHMQTNDKHYFNPTAPVVVASVDTLIKRVPTWLERIKLVVVDEAAHVLKDNKWGRAVAMFPNARGLLVTATPLRADGHGLGRVGGKGIVDCMIEGPTMRELIQEGYLSSFRIFAPPNALDLSTVNVTPSGDYSGDPLRQAVKKAQLTGNVVEHYKRHGGGLGITFAVSVEAAQELAQAYSDAGVPAVCLHAGTGILERASVMRRFRDGVIQQLVNVDILGEGVDVPAVQSVSLARPTASYGLYMQQVGRALRPSEGKDHAIILDHAGNVMRHGLPDNPRTWTLTSRDRKSRGASGAMPLRVCLNVTCMGVFPRNLDRCTWCKHPVPVAKERARPEEVEGNLLELSSTFLSNVRAQIKKLESAPKIPRGVTGVVAASIVKRHHARQDAQRALKDAISVWAGLFHEKGESDSEIYRRFWHQFGIDILSAQTLGAQEAKELIEKLNPDSEFLKKKS